MTTATTKSPTGWTVAFALFGVGEAVLILLAGLIFAELRDLKLKTASNGERISRVEALVDSHVATSSGASTRAGNRIMPRVN